MRERQTGGAGIPYSHVLRPLFSPTERDETMTTPNTILQQLIPLAEAHQQADDYVAGSYGDPKEPKACAIGCTINDARRLGRLGVLNGVTNSDHAAIAAATGVPEAAWRLLDRCFESMPEAERSALPPRFLRSAAAGANLASVPARISARLMRRLEADALDGAVRSVAALVASLYERRGRGDEPSKGEWDAARQQAYAAEQQAYAAGQQWWSWCADMLCEELAR